MQAPPLRRLSRTPRETERASQAHQLCDYQTLHFVRAFPDFVDFLIAVHTRDRILVHEAVPTVDLHGFIDDAAREFARIQLRQTRAHVELAAVVFFPCRFENHQLRVLDLHLHIGELELDRLKF